MKSLIRQIFEVWRKLGTKCHRRNRLEESIGDNHSTKSCWRRLLPASWPSGRSPLWVKSPLFGLMCLNMLVCGIEFCASAGLTYIPPMLLKAGFGEASMTCVMAVGPFLALFSVPILGQWSDRCQSRFGRRRPFIFGIAMLIIISLILIAYGQKIGNWIAPGLNFGVVLLFVGVVFLDYGCHTGFNPCEALVADVMEHSDDKELGFTVYSNMASLGGCIGYLITAMDWSHGFSSRMFESQEQTAFTFILILFIGALMTTLVSADDRRYIPTKRLSNVTVTVPPSSLYPALENGEGGYDDCGYETGSNGSQDDFISTSYVPTRTPTPTMEGSQVVQVTKMYISKDGPRTLHSLRLSFRTFLKWPPSILKVLKNAFHSFCDKLRTYFQVPRVLRTLFVADFCSWTALMCHNMFYTDYVGQAVYGGNPNAEDSSMARGLYDAGVRMGSWGLLLHSITSILYASCFQKVIMKWYGMSKAYLFGLVIFTFCMMGTLLSKNLVLINIFAALSGTGFATITTIPYMLVSAYHNNSEVYFSDRPRASNHLFRAEDGISKGHILDSQTEDAGAEHDSHGYGGDLAILDAAYFISQIILSLFVGTIVDFTHSVAMYLAISAGFGLLACYYSTKVTFPPD